MSTSKHSISLERAKQLTSSYRKNKKKVLKDEYHNKATLPVCETFEREAFDELLSQPGCVSIRFYFGMDEEMNVTLVFVGVDENDKDMLPQQAGDMTMMATSAGGDAGVYDNSTRCPPTCPPDSTLNTD